MGAVSESSGLISHWAGGPWQDSTTVSQLLISVWGSSETGVWVGGQEGSLLGKLPEVDGGSP